jgi:hypothetical protein
VAAALRFLIVVVSLQEYTQRAARTGDGAALCRIALHVDLGLGHPELALPLLAQAAHHDHLPALHELARVAARNGDAPAALSALDALARAFREGARVPQPSEPLSPSPSSGLTAEWVVSSSWSGEQGWVSLAPDVLGKDFFGETVPFDWQPDDGSVSDGASESGETLEVLTPEPERAEEVLGPVVADELMRTSWQGELVDPQASGRPHTSDLRRTDRGVRVGFDMQGVVPAPMGRAVVRLLARTLTAHEVPAHIANGNPGWVGTYLRGRTQRPVS